MARYDLVINGSPYAVEVLDLGATHATVVVNGVTYTVEIPAGACSAATTATPAPRPAAPPAQPAVAASRAAPARPAPSPQPPAGGEVVHSPMPGHILSVSVKAGDAVEAGDTVVVMEAMKMENEIKAHVAGRVLEVKVSKGQDVGVSEPLIVIGEG
jgi:biotin carboxyl carrier protein